MSITALLLFSLGVREVTGSMPVFSTTCSDVRCLGVLLVYLIKVKRTI